MAQQIEDINIAAYLDEADVDIDLACLTLTKNNINYAILRKFNGVDICLIDECQYKNIRSTLESYNISVIGINCTTINNLVKSLQIANYFKSQFIIISIDNIEDLYDAAESMNNDYIVSNITPLIEYNGSFSVDKTNRFLSKFKNWRVLFDPVMLIANNKHNIFNDHFLGLKDNIDCVDVRDYKAGYGPKIVGFGESNISSIISSLGDNYKGWYFLEPSFGNRFGHNRSKPEIFGLAVDGFSNLLLKLNGENDEREHNRS